MDWKSIYQDIEIKQSIEKGRAKCHICQGEIKPWHSPMSDDNGGYVHTECAEEAARKW